MGMSTHVVGFKAPDAEWVKMKAVWDACKAAEITPPEEVIHYFEWREPRAGIEVPERDLIHCGAVREFNTDSTTGYEIILSKVPEGVTVISVYNSY